MGCAYTGSAGGPIRTEIPIPICAGDGVESDNTETDNIKTPKTDPTTKLRTERFIFISLSFDPIILTENRQPGPITFRPY
jgi:hypothetical protein